MNWGTKLIIGMLLFMSFIMILVIFMTTSKTDALVENNYYEKGLNYDDTYLHKTQVIKDNAVPVIRIKARQLIITFKSNARGNIKLMRIADQRMDRNIDFDKVENNALIISLKDIAAGQWKLIANWTNYDGKKYLYEKEIKLP